MLGGFGRRWKDSERVRMIRKGFEAFRVKRIWKELKGFPPVPRNKKRFLRLGKNPIMIVIIFGELGKNPIMIAIILGEKTRKFKGFGRS